MDGFFVATWVLSCAVAGMYVVMFTEHRFATSVSNSSDLRGCPIQQEGNGRVQNVVLLPENYRECTDS